MTVCILILLNICHVYLTEIFEYIKFGYNVRRKKLPKFTIHRLYHLKCQHRKLFNKMQNPHVNLYIYNGNDHHQKCLELVRMRSSIRLVDTIRNPCVWIQVSNYPPAQRVSVGVYHCYTYVSYVNLDILHVYFRCFSVQKIFCVLLYSWIKIRLSTPSFVNCESPQIPYILVGDSMSLEFDD